MNGMTRICWLFAAAIPLLAAEAQVPQVPPPPPPAVIAPVERPAVEAPTAARPQPPAQPSAPPAGVSPGTNDRYIAVAVRKHLEKEHYLKQPINDEIARRWFTSFLEALDPWKLYFLQSDVDTFAQRRESLDDLVKRGDVNFAYEVLDRFLQRVDQRLPMIERLIQQPHDFNASETIVTDRDETKWARNEAEAEDLWRRRIKYDLLVQKMEKTPLEEAKEKLLRRYRSLAKRWHQMTADELLETYLTTLTSSFIWISKFSCVPGDM